MEYLIFASALGLVYCSYLSFKSSNKTMKLKNIVGWIIAILVSR